MTFRKVFHPILLSSKAKALRRRRVHLCDPYLSTVSWRIQDRLCIFSLCFSFLFPPSYLTTYTYLPTYSARPAGCRDILPFARDRHLVTYHNYFRFQGTQVFRILNFNLKSKSLFRTQIQVLEMQIIT